MFKLPFSTTTITIYNQYREVDPLTNKTFTMWFRRILENCSWGKAESTRIGIVMIGSDDFKAKIPKHPDYLKPWEWTALPIGLLPSKFTLNTGDIAIEGIAEEELSANASTQKLFDKYAGRIFTINKVFDYSGNGETTVPLPHYEIGGK